VPTLPISFTVSEGEEYMEKFLDRKRLHNIQLPQLFKTEILKEVHKKAIEDHFLATEDSMLAFKYGYKVRFIKGSESNIKITTPLDLLIVDNIVKGEHSV
jgi:2-C-methyl-D-erythritol 4-phosphate cytidylyltransferase